MYNIVMEPDKDHWVKIDAIVHGFEKAWQSGAHPDIDDFLPAGGPDRLALLAELVKVDSERRRQAGESVPVEEYLRRYPELAGLPGSTTSDGHGSAAMPLRRLGDFEIIRELGRGGMGVVYEARQVSLNRKVALKVLSAGLGLTSKAVQRFRREAEAAAKLHHTNIVPVYATGEQDGTHFYAMELIDGPSLNHVIRQLRQAPKDGPAGLDPAPSELAAGDLAPSGAALAGTHAKSPDTVSAAAGGHSSQLSSAGQYFDTVARMTADVADALEHAHQHGVIHRDIKPANLLLSPDGRLSVNDFGLARLLEQPGVTMTGEFMGTPLYMSPEQITAGRTPLDHRTDIYSLGATLYELLTLRAPFAAEQRDLVLAQILHKEPVLPRRLNRKVPVDLETICLKALEKDPDRRYSTAQAMAEDLRRYLNRFAIVAKRVGPVARLIKLARRHKLATAAGAVMLLLASAAGVTTWLYHRGQQEIARQEANTQAAREEVDRARRKNEAMQKVRHVERLIKEQKFREAFALLEHEVAPYLPGDQRIDELRTECSWVRSILTDPPGVDVFRKPIDDLGGAWEHLGRTPIEKARLAREFCYWKLEKPGYETAEGFGLDHWQALIAEGDRLHIQLDPQGSRLEGMVRVTAQGRLLDVSGLRTRAVALVPFHIDRCEVTNRQFKQFVDQGGYQKKDFWEQPFVKEGKPLSWEQALTEFHDATGRPGPATWELGSFPDGQGDHPVAGVSWYEAAAYAKFAGKTLPTVYDWLAASGYLLAGEIIPRSNFGRTGLARVGQYRGLGPFGTYDMAGNVKEWCFNGAGDGMRYLLGGAWDEQPYMFSFPDARSPFHRAPNCGFRCVKYLSGREPPAEAFREEKRPGRDFLKEKRLTDAEFEFVRRAYAYDKRDLNAWVVREEETAYWVRERVEYDAAYGKERAVAYLFLPRNVHPPYQPVIFWPHAGAWYLKAIEPIDYGTRGFLVRSGRALVWPIYKGTYERQVASVSAATPEWERGAVEAWELRKQQVNDLQRVIDYLQTRNDMNTGAIGYYGLSWGAARVASVLAVENRIKAAVLDSGGLNLVRWQRPELDPVHYLPRIKIPVLMLNGEYDAIFPRLESQEPMFQLLGTPAEHKKHSLSKDSHDALIIHGRVQETLEWFDRYLGPVTPNSAPAAAPGLRPAAAE
jgi:serine/threonine protein kinase/dienelactone hydrolase